MMESRKSYQIRNMKADLVTRSAENEAPKIEGYFAVFNSNYEMGCGMSEEIDSHAFDGALSDDIRALINHDDTLVLGRTNAGTLHLRIDEHGLYGTIDINPNDTDAMNLYARVQRGDVSQCSFGFDIIDEDTEIRDDNYHWIIKKVKLYEVSPCTFPAYESTAIDARKSDKANIEKRENEVWKNSILKRLKGE